MRENTVCVRDSEYHRVITVSPINEPWNGLQVVFTRDKRSSFDECYIRSKESGNAARLYIDRSQIPTVLSLLRKRIAPKVWFTIGHVQSIVPHTRLFVS